MFDIIIPIYKIKPKFLEQCLVSINAQTFENFETWIVDGTPEDWEHYDEDMELISRYPHFNYIRQSGKGVSQARNEGICQGTNSHIAFLDGDDFLPKYTLKELGEVVVKQQADVITFNWAYFNGTKNSKNLEPQRRDLKRFPDKKIELIRRFLSVNFDGSVIYTMTSKKLLDDNAIRFPEGLHEDISVIFKIYYYVVYCCV